MDWLRSIFAAFTAEEWQALAAWATFAVAVAAAVVALVQHRSSVHARLEQSRPYVSVDFEFLGGVIAVIEIKNTGLTGARDVRFDWSSPLVAEDDSAQRPIDRTLIDEGIPFLAPGRSMQFYYRATHDNSWPENVAKRYHVKATYNGSGDKRRWTSESVLDLEQWVEVMVEQRPPELIAGALKKIAEAVGPFKGAGRKVEAAADSIHAYLEAGPRLTRYRQEQRNQSEARFAAHKEREARRQAQLAEQAALARSTDDGDGSDGEPVGAKP